MTHEDQLIIIVMVATPFIVYGLLIVIIDGIVRWSNSRRR